MSNGRVRTDWRRGFTVGALVFAVGAASTASRSSTPMMAIAEFLLFGALFSLPLVAAWYLTRNDAKTAASVEPVVPGPGGRLW